MIKKKKKEFTVNSNKNSKGARESARLEMTGAEVLVFSFFENFTSLHTSNSCLPSSVYSLKLCASLCECGLLKESTPPPPAL